MKVCLKNGLSLSFIAMLTLGNLAWGSQLPEVWGFPDGGVNTLKVKAGSSKTTIIPTGEGQASVVVITKTKEQSLDNLEGCKARVERYQGRLNVDLENEGQGCVQEIEIRVPKSANIEVEGTSAAVNVQGMASSKVRIIVDSGEIVIDHDADSAGGDFLQMVLETESGKIYARVNTLFEKNLFRLKSTSGNMVLALPSDTEFSLLTRTSSGHVENEFDSVGGSKSRVQIDTWNGDVSIKKN